MAIRIAVNGSEGRMGQRILALAAASSEFEVAGGFDQSKPLKDGALSGNGVLIDFSSPSGAPAAAVAAKKAGWGLVVGTTGLDKAAEDAIRDAAKAVPVVYSANMSVGVNLVARLLADAAKALGDDFRMSMSEAHHVHKKDAPSGTALMLRNALASGKGWDASKAASEVRIESIREGEIVGDHTVLFDGPAETIEITHHAKSRDVFAQGALTAAAFLSKNGKPGKLYTMQDVLFS